MVVHETPETWAAYMRRYKAERLLHGPRLVHGVGVQRMLQALARDGWSQTTLAARLGVTRVQVSTWQRGRKRVRPETEQTVWQLFLELAGSDGGCTRSRRHAERSGWAPARVWDSESIRNPLVEWPPPATARVLRQ